jgi:DNA repair protein RadD
MVMSPTGSDTTILAMFLIHEALLRDKRVIFVADRRTLIHQTSEVADSLGLVHHSDMMADSWRYDPALPFQIASAQTLAMRDWPDADLVIIDEARTQLKVWTEHIASCRAAVIGLSATPFSKGLGKLFSNLVNATTMAELTASGVLVPMRVLSCTRVDMRGAATAGGEWTDQAAAARGMATYCQAPPRAERFFIGALDGSETTRASRRQCRLA